MVITSIRESDDLSIGFDRDRGRRQCELPNNKSIKGKNHVSIRLKDILGFAEHQVKATYGLGYQLVLTRNSDNAVLNKNTATNIGKVRINAIEWYVPPCTPSIQQQTMLFKQITNKTLTELQYVERSVFMKEVNNENIWRFELGTQEGINVPLWIILGFKQSDRQHNQNLNNDTFFGPPVTSAHCVIGTEKYPDSGVLFNYDDDDYSQGYRKIKEAFRALKNDDILQQYISDHDFRSSNVGDSFGYNLYVFDKRHQNLLDIAQPINIEFKFTENVPAGLYGYALVLTNKLVSVSSDGQRHFDFFYVQGFHNILIFFQ